MIAAHLPHFVFGSSLKPVGFLYDNSTCHGGLPDVTQQSAGIAPRPWANSQSQQIAAIAAQCMHAPPLFARRRGDSMGHRRLLAGPVACPSPPIFLK